MLFKHLVLWPIVSFDTSRSQEICSRCNTFQILLLNFHLQFHRFDPDTVPDKLGDNAINNEYYCNKNILRPTRSTRDQIEILSKIKYGDQCKGYNGRFIWTHLPWFKVEFCCLNPNCVESSIKLSSNFKHTNDTETHKTNAIVEHFTKDLFRCAVYVAFYEWTPDIRHRTLYRLEQTSSESTSDNSLLDVVIRCKFNPVWLFIIE